MALCFAMNWNEEWQIHHSIYRGWIHFVFCGGVTEQPSTENLTEVRAKRFSIPKGIVFSQCIRRSCYRCYGYSTQLLDLVQFYDQFDKSLIFVVVEFIVLQLYCLNIEPRRRRS